MPLRHVDPTRKPTVVVRALNRAAHSRFGRLVARRVAPRVDPWLGRVSHGRVNLGMFNVPSAPLKTTGAKSGQRRQSQVAYFHDGSDVVILASNYGGDKHPQWYHNLVAHPDCELGDEAFRAAEVTDPDTYARLFGLAEQHFDLFTDYRAKSASTGRTIPVFLLTPHAG